MITMDSVTGDGADDDIVITTGYVPDVDDGNLF
jgi:hypothetical protein